MTCDDPSLSLPHSLPPCPPLSLPSPLPPLPPSLPSPPASFQHLKSQSITVTVSDVFVILGTSECPSDADAVRIARQAQIQLFMEVLKLLVGAPKKQVAGAEGLGLECRHGRTCPFAAKARPTPQTAPAQQRWTRWAMPSA